ncbi:diacylglycerol/lipid kinase family protein [Hydrogenophaga palleronii]|uniref:diacylglycerol/lipid kinase family protein n=1 Tax=Hydrogenophaga palleronii TaxID=65655 RepID=UPI0008256159|nr:diacylglycerol kinase family protein [Hydrogenophaga palleronii]
MNHTPTLDPAATLHFILNGRAGSQEQDDTREAIESALTASGRQGQLHVCEPAELPQVAAECAALALQAHGAIVAVGGDGTINTVAQAAHAAGCTMGVIPRGTFNYFARTHGIEGDAAEAMEQLLAALPQPVQVAAVNQQVFLVNASVGLYPDLLEDRESWKARFGRSRLVALGAAATTLLRAQRQLTLQIELDGSVRKLRTLTLFAGNNRLQLEQLGMLVSASEGNRADNGRVTAIMLKPLGSLAMLGLMLRGAMGSLGEAEGIEHIEFQRMVVQPPKVLRFGRMKVAFDGEVARMKPPLDFRVLPTPLWLLKPEMSPAAAAAV